MCPEHHRCWSLGPIANLLHFNLFYVNFTHGSKIFFLFVIEEIEV